MRFTNRELYQAYNDLGDFWDVYQQAFDPADVEANMFDRYKGVTMSPVTPYQMTHLLKETARLLTQVAFFSTEAINRKLSMAA